MVNEVLSAAAVVLTVAIFWPYAAATRAGRITPHVFSWVIWTLVTVSVFFAQIADGGGIGAWPIGLSGVITAYVATLAWLRRADLEITRSDGAFLVGALSALPVWWVTSDPLWAVVILTVVDLSGFGPTARSAYHRPHEEQLRFFALAAVRNALVIAALEHHSVTTVLFPAAVGLGCLALVALLVVRRRRVPPKSLPDRSAWSARDRSQRLR